MLCFACVGSRVYFLVLKHLGLADFPMISSGSLSVPLILVHTMAVSRSLLFGLHY